MNDFSKIVPGMGPAGVSVIAEKIDSFNELFDLDKTKLMGMTTSKGRRVFREATAEAFLELLEFFEPSEDLTSNWVRLSTLKFVDQNIKGVEAKKGIDDLNIDPFIVREFNLGPEEIVRFFLYQTVSRGVVTSMGDQFEKLAKISHLDTTEQPGFDGELVREGKKFFIQVKSGPDVLNKDMLERLGQHMEKAKGENPGSEALLGLCYGTPDQISDKIRRYLPGEGLENVMIGEEFWDFLAGEEGYYKRLLHAIYQASVSYPQFKKKLHEVTGKVNRGVSKNQQELGGTGGEPGADTADSSIVEVIEKKIEDLLEDWQKKYGSLDSDTVDRMIEDHM